MKTLFKLLTITVVMFGFITPLTAQAPAGFSYQAVVRDDLGEVLADQAVSLRISILQGSTGGPVIYQEEHTATTNGFGLVNLQIGTGTVVSGDFSVIAWGTDLHFLQIELDEAGGSAYEMMGVSQLLSVPYALYAEKSGSPDSTLWEKNFDDIYYNKGNVGIGEMTPTGRLVVKSDTVADVDDLIFSILNSSGDTVMAVYQQGVRIYVADDTTGGKASGSKGGFAVGGFSSGKSELTNEYLRVTPDSVRIYIEEGDGGKASKGGFAVGGFSSGKGFTNDFMKITDDSSRIWTDGPGGFEVLDLASGSANYLDLSPDNYFIGHNAGINTTTGLYNSFIGFESGYENTEGEDNIFIGYESGYSNANGYENIFMGNGSGYYNSSGYDNVIIGNYAGYYNDTSAYNIFIGNYAGYSNTFGNSNVIIGDAAGESNTTGNSNVFIGDWCGANNTEGEDNIMIGDEAGWTNTTGNWNIFIGASSGHLNETGDGNIFIGDATGYSNTIGEDNIFIGTESGYANTEGSTNVFLGNGSGFSNITGNDNVLLGQETGYALEEGYGNVFVGNYAGGGIISGDCNTFIGVESGYENAEGDSNVFIGSYAGYYEHGSNLLYIDNSDTDYPLIYGDFENDKVTLNDVLILSPRDEEPADPVEGEIYVNGITHHIYCYLNDTWVQLD